jgi:streptogramin lyase
MTSNKSVSPLVAVLALVFFVSADSSCAQNLFAGTPTTIQEYNASGQGTTFANYTGGASSFVVGLAFDSKGDLFESDWADDEILEFNSSGHATVFANASSGLQAPVGLAVDSDGNIYVGELSSSIEEFNPSGQGRTFATGVSSPHGLAFDGNGNLFVAESYPSTITIEEFNSSGQGTVFASSAGSALDPTIGLTFDSKGNLFAAAQGNIDEYNSSGQETVFASYTTSNLGEPFGVAFDNSGNLFVSDIADGNIDEFNSSGQETLFASGLDHPSYIAFQATPEPSPWMLLAMGSVTFLGFRQRH